MTIAIADVATHVDLANEVGSKSALDNLLNDTMSAKKALELTLADVVDHLRNRTPPIGESDIADVTQLRRVVVEGTLARLYRSNITTGDGEDVSSVKHKIYQRAYENTLAALRPDLTGGAVPASFSIAFHRR
jgi:hypothetical protein